MKRLGILVVVLALSGTGCSSDSDNPVGPSTVVTLAAQMSGSQNVPPAGSLEAGATGSVLISLTPTSGGAYTATFTLQMGGLVKSGILPSPLDNGSAIVAGLVQQGAAGTVGAPVLQLPISQAAPLVSPTGSIQVTFSGVDVTAATASAVLANPGGFYVCMYSALNQAGVMRGQLVKQ